MTSIIRTSLDNDRSHAALFFLRVLVASFLLIHGLPKVGTLFAGGEIKFADPIGLGPTFSFILVTFAEVVCAVLILIGLGTRLAAIPLIINFTVICFIVHGADPWQLKELAFLFLVLSLTFLVLGPGKYSVDGMLTRRWKKRWAMPPIQREPSNVMRQMPGPVRGTAKVDSPAHRPWNDRKGKDASGNPSSPVAPVKPSADGPL